MENNIFEKLAQLSGETANQAMPGEPVPEATPVMEQAIPTDELPEPEAQLPPAPQDLNSAIEQAANEASANVGDLLEDPPMASMAPQLPQGMAEPVYAEGIGEPTQEDLLQAQLLEAQQLEQLQAEQAQLEGQVTERLAEFGALARVVELAHTTDEGDDFQKSASALLGVMLSDEAAYAENIEKVASSLYAEQEDLDALYQYDAVEYVAGLLEHRLLPELNEKIASDLSDEAAGNTIVNKTRSAVDGFVQSFQRLKGINGEIATLESKLQEAKNIHSQLGLGVGMGTEQEQAARAISITNAGQEAMDLQHQIAGAENFRAKGYGLAALGAGGLAGGAYMAGRALFNQKQEEPSLNELQTDDTLNAGNDTFNPENGGNYKMANETVFMDEILKLAGANFLLGTANDPQAGQEMNKLASDEFDRIASLNREDMGVEFVRTALENYDEQTLREVVAGVHTEELLEKTAGFVSLDNLSADELEKVAGASSVSAKGAAGALRDATEKVENVLIQAKERAQGAGRQYAGENGKFGGALVDDMSGLNVINNPAKYEIEQTAAFQADIEQAVLLKQAAEAAYNEADAFLKQAFTN